MQQALRPYITGGVALVGASLIAVTPVTPPPVVQLPVQLAATSWADLFTNTSDNLQNIFNNANFDDISKVIGELFTNPLGVIGAFTNITPDVTTDLTSLPATISVELPPGLALAISSLGAQVATDNAIQQVITDAGGSGGFAALFNGLPTILNAYLNGSDNVSLLGGIINIPLLNGVLAPLQPMEVNLSLTNLVDALGLGNLKLTDLDLSSLLSQLGLGNLTLGSLFSDLGISDKGLGDLLGGGNPLDLGSLLDKLGLNGLNLGSLNLSNLLGLGNLDKLTGSLSLQGLLSGTTLGNLHLDAPLGSLSLTDLLNALGLNNLGGSLNLTGVIDGLFGNLNVGSVDVGHLLDQLGLGSVHLGDLLNTPALSGLLSAVTTTLNGLLGSTLSSVGGLLNPILSALGLNIGNLVNGPDLVTALNNVDLGHLLAGTLLGNGGVLNLNTLLADLGLSGISSPLTSITNLLSSLGVSLPSGNFPDVSDLLTGLLHGLGINATASNLTVSGLLGDLGLLGGSTGPLSLDGLLGGLNLDNLDVTSLLNGLNLGDLLGDLGLNNLPLNLSDLGDLSNLTLGNLLGDLGLGDLANISVEPLGGYYTELFDTVPQQILAALGS